MGLFGVQHRIAVKFKQTNFSCYSLRALLIVPKRANKIYAVLTFGIEAELNGTVQIL
jgi:hypothetical protein